MSKYLTKGKQIGVAGELEQNIWQGNDGAKHNMVQINVSEISLLASPRGVSGGNESPPPGKNADPGEDDIPF
jgi:single-stranded DNA-binding protein